MSAASGVYEPDASAPLLDEELCAAVVALAGRRIVALTGAGISTESGIPDYRGPVTRQRARAPMRFSQFAGDEGARRRYWARATLGWLRIRDAAPNEGHQALAALEARGKLRGVITQNVDGLHRAAGARQVVELHGALREVVCLACGALEERARVHARLMAANESWAVPAPAAHAPDGDVDLSDELVSRFRVVGCASCGGALKPRVVFFGENVEAETLARAWQVFDDAEALLVVGSSLEVFSGRRFVEEAARRRWPIVLVNLGPVRRGELATVHLDARAGAVLPRLAHAL
jgi:NAD+-dependent protein deacetylase sirtuin 4